MINFYIRYRRFDAFEKAFGGVVIFLGRKNRDGCRRHTYELRCEKCKKSIETLKWRARFGLLSTGLVTRVWKRSNCNRVLCIIN